MVIPITAHISLSGLGRIDNVYITGDLLPLVAFRSKVVALRSPSRVVRVKET